MPPKTETRTFKFKAGEITRLDNIYEFNGLWASDWWEPVNDMNSVGGVASGAEAIHASGETIRITRNITITIKRTVGPVVDFPEPEGDEA